jgi:predicted DNA-binding transcriptional regulator YafY
VRVRFDAPVVRSATRRAWHPSQTKRPRKLPDGGVELALRVAPDFEVENLAMRFGEHAEIIEPRELRAKIARRAAAMAKRYAAESVVATASSSSPDARPPGSPA